MLLIKSVTLFITQTERKLQKKSTGVKTKEITRVFLIHISYIY